MQSSKAVQATTKADAKYQEGLVHKKAQRFVQARESFEQGCQEGSAKCWTEMGIIHYKGGYNDLAVKCYEKGAAGGHERGQYMLAILVGRGEGIPKNLNRALELLAPLIDRIPEAQTQYDNFAAELKQTAPANLKLDPIHSNPHLRVTIKQIPYKQLTYGQVLGAGAFGEVYQGTWQRSNVAIKQLQVDSPGCHDLKKELLDEASILWRLRSPRVVMLYGLSETPEQALIMVMEFARFGNLNRLLQKQPFSWAVKINLGADIGVGLGYLHENGVFHRDLKAENILVAEEDGRLCAKIGDLGLAKVKYGNNTTVVSVNPRMVGRTYGLPPEFLGKGNRCVATTQSDVYSLGGVFLEMATHSIDVSEHDIPESTPEAFKTAILKCRLKDPSDRPSAYEVAGWLGDYKSDDEAPESTGLDLSGSGEDVAGYARVEGYLQYSPRNSDTLDRSGFYRDYGGPAQGTQYATPDLDPTDGNNDDETSDAGVNP